MYSFLIAGPPFYGHVHPMLTVAKELVDRGHDVRYLTGSRYSDAVAATGAEFVRAPKDSDFDDREMAENSPALTGLREMRKSVIGACITPAAAQYDALVAESARRRVDVVLADPTFFGAALLAAHPVGARPFVVGGGILPLMLSSRFAPPFGMGVAPRGGRLDRVKNTALRAVVQNLALREVQEEYAKTFQAIHGRRPDYFAFDWYGQADGIVQFTVPSFEYPRPDVPVDLRFAGPVNRVSGFGGGLPDWWDEVRQAKHVVVATQGTYRNVDLSEMIKPAIEAFAAQDVLLVVTTGGRPVQNLGPLPGNVRAAEYISYHDLLPLADVFVTNGGYGGVHYAMQYGVPVVVAGVTEDKPECCARVEWSGMGIRLRTGHPTAKELRRAVHQVLSEPSYKHAAQRLGEEVSDARGVDVLLELVHEKSFMREWFDPTPPQESGGDPRGA